MSDDGLGVLGSKVTEAIEHIEAVYIGDSATPETLTEVVLKVSEFTAVCPITGQPDYYDIDIAYIPNKHIVESKSLKLWLWKFRNEGVFCEHLSNWICEEIHAQVKPERVSVTVKQSPRGGIAIEARSVLDDE